MNDKHLFIKFIISLKTSEKLTSNSDNPTGIMFTKFLPDGEKDAIIKLNDEYKISFWFEQHGVQAKNKYIKYEYNKKEFNPDDISKIGCLDSGYLFGKLEYYNIDDIDLTELLADRLSNEKYIKLAKNIIKIIDDNVNQLIDIFRYKYGQFWVNPYKKWDSRFTSITDYCRFYISARFHNEQKHEYVDLNPIDKGFKPETKTFTITIHEITNLLTKSDWVELNELISNKQYIISDSLKVLQLAHISFKNSDYSIAFIELNIAIELAIKEYFIAKNKTNKLYHHYTEKLRNLSIIDQLTNICIINDLCTPEELEICVKVIKERNEIIHDGKSIDSQEYKKDFYITADVINRLMPFGKIYFPNFPSYNTYKLDSLNENKLKEIK